MATTTWNPSDKAAGMTLSNLNLTATFSSGSAWVRAVDKQDTGKAYWEITATTIAQLQSGIGIASLTMDPTQGFTFGAPSAPSCAIVRGGVIYSDGNSSGIGLGTITNGTVVCFAYDASARRMWVRLGAAGNWNNNVANNPATGVGGISTSLGTGGASAYPVALLLGAAETVTANFGASGFTGAVPAGFTAGFPPAGGAGAAQALAMVLA